MSQQSIAIDWAAPALLRSWTFDPWLAVLLGLSAAIYVRGWLRLHRRAPQRFAVGHIAVFLSGLAAIVIALESPLHALGPELLQAHMIQHLLLLMVAPPLIWLGAPLLPMLHGLPRRLRRRWMGPLLAWPPLVRIGRGFVHPALAWVAFVGSTWAWHMPALYERALASDTWHYAQHACFLATALAFWWPVVQPWPSRLQWPRSVMLLYLILADLQNTVLSAWLIFAERLLYPGYGTMPRLWGISPLDDQAAAGALMWVPGSVAFLLPVAWLVGQMLSPQAGPKGCEGLRMRLPADTAARETASAGFTDMVDGSSESGAIVMEKHGE
jgi:cytochrome c oxidase assembly factor CtaG